MTTLGLIGSGNIGGTVARLAIAAGLDVVVSNSRGPETLVGLVQELGDRARAGTTDEAAQDGDIVVVAIPLRAYPDVPVEPLAGKLVLETLNYYPQRDGVFPELDSGAATSSELVQRHLAGARLVKAFNNIYWAHLLNYARPSGASDRSALPIAGDDPAAREEATRLLDRLGWDAVDAGTLADSWRFEPGTPAYGAPYMADPSVGIAGLATDPGTTAPAEKVRDALAAAGR
ncbi:NADP oxidoreductase [Streptomyces sp. 8K308]|uniref:NADPH-dependent F420 reductase n=1 Tax=Streptomyces sp. 8K308 TaxID=2530388 RepID=UPI001052EF6D|nr:NADPH-dependent F420 reductase [Streptomyces sp. 8K308]TDC24955.1 NADP oxidoreductase [Streptomyces sp. 8K308]